MKFSPRDGDDPIVKEKAPEFWEFSPRDGDDPRPCRNVCGFGQFSPRDGDDPDFLKFAFAFFLVLPA